MSKSIFVACLRFYKYDIISISSVSIYHFPSSSLSYIPFHSSSSCPVYLARTSSTLLSRSGNSRYPCLVPDMRGQAFNFSSFSMLVILLLEIYPKEIKSGSGRDISLSCPLQLCSQWPRFGNDQYLEMSQNIIVLKKGNLPFSIPWRNLEDIILSEAGHR